LVEVRDMFPKQWAKLQALADAYEKEVETSDVEDDDPFLHGVCAGRVYDGLYDRVHHWTCKNEISCPAVDAAATLLVVGWEGPEQLVYLGHHDDWIQARPNETLDEFRERATQHYKEMHESYEQAGFVQGPVKREHMHFRYLAAYLVGQYQWARIARGQTPFEFPVKSVTTIAGEARKAARLIGLHLRDKPGPRPNPRTHVKSRRHRP
jgi:hypothetical protein